MLPKIETSFQIPLARAKRRSAEISNTRIPTISFISGLLKEEQVVDTRGRKGVSGSGPGKTGGKKVVFNLQFRQREEATKRFLRSVDVERVKLISGAR